MPGLVRDRYFEYAPERAWDLVTGEAVSTTEGEDEPKATGPAPAALIELLDHGVEGFPRRFALDAGRMPWHAAARSGAAAAQRRGYGRRDGTLEECRAGCSPFVAATSDLFK